MNFSKQKLDFFNHHNIDLNLVFDAHGTGLVWKKLKEVMYNSDTIFAAWTNKCNNWHDIKTRSWHCPVCDTERISHTLRNIKKNAYVYVVASKKWELLKIWFTGKKDDRLHHLNKDGYGWFNDWLFLYYAKYEKAWEVELELHNKLKDYNFWVVYNHYWKDVRCYELFKCGYEKVKEAITSCNIDIDSVISIFNNRSSYLYKRVISSSNIAYYDF